MDRNELLASITSLELQKANLTAELEEVELNLKVQRAQYSRQLNEDALIYRLPNELLTGIFMTCKYHTPSRRVATPRLLPFPVIASHVSHSWREVALGTPLLWNVIDFHVRPMNHVQKRILSQLKAHLERSDACFLDITLYFHVVDELSTYFSLLAAHSTRWRRLSIATRFEQVDDILELLQFRAPILEHLSLNLGKPQEGSLSPRKQFNAVSTSIFTQGAPCLSFVRLAGLALGNLHPPTASVTTLHLDGWTRHYMTHEQFRVIFEGAPSLVNLSLNQLCIHHPRDPLAVIHPTSLPHLRCLRIRGPCSPLSRLISLMDMPHLHSLSLQSVDTFDSDRLQSVESLCLDSCAFDEHEIGNLIRALPAISSLSIDESMPDIFFMLLPNAESSETSNTNTTTTTTTPTPTPTWPWQNLRTIAVTDLQTADVPHFCNTVLTRGEALRKVLLDRRSRTVLRGKNRLDWLQERLVVENADQVEPWPLGLGYEDAHDLLE